MKTAQNEDPKDVRRQSRRGLPQGEKPEILIQIKKWGGGGAIFSPTVFGVSRTAGKVGVPQYTKSRQVPCMHRR